MLDMSGAMVIIYSSIWSAVLLICLKKHYLIDSGMGVIVEWKRPLTWELEDLDFDLSSTTN